MLKIAPESDQATLLRIISEQQETIDKLNQQLIQLQSRLDKLLHLLYGTKNEKRKGLIEACKNNPPSRTLKDSQEQKPKGRRPFPLELPRVSIEHDLPVDEQACDCGCRMVRMGKVVTEQLDLKPAELFVKEHIRYKYVCRICQKIVTADLPPQPIDKGLPGPGLLAEVIVNKYQDALPLHRQEKRFARYGIDLPRSTLCDWVMESAFLLEPIVQLMKKEELLKGHRIFTDDTPVPVLAKGKTHQGRLWVYIGGGFDKPIAVIYDYTPTRSQKGPQQFLRGYKGYLQADAYAGYDILYRTGDIIEVACLAHCRRRFFDITLATQVPGLAEIALDFIGKLYEIERTLKPFTPLQRKYFRRKYSKPVLRKFKRWLLKNKKKLLPKTPIGQAVAYALRHWQALNNYLRDGTLEIDNNRSERAMKPIVIGRLNWLFAGSHEGARKAAILYSIIETCKLNEINPFIYLKDVLTKLPTTLAKDLPTLLPYHWKKSVR